MHPLTLDNTLGHALLKICRKLQHIPRFRQKARQRRLARERQGYVLVLTVAPLPGEGVPPGNVLGVGGVVLPQARGYIPRL